MRKELDDLTRPIIDIYNQIELDLLEAIAKRFDVYDKVGGSLEWQVKKLDEMGALNADAVKIISSYSKKSEKEIRKMLKEAGFGNVDLPAMQKAYNSGALLVDPAKIIESETMRSTVEDSFKELKETFKLINTKALESVKQEYMTVVNKAYIDVSSGVFDYNTAIKKALKGMADNGITGATYQRGGKIVKYSIEAAVRRDALTAVHQTANRNSFKLAEELGAEYVEVSSHVGARTHPTNHIANHAWWQGKVYKIHGFDEKYGNLKNNTGYPDDIQGLGGVALRRERSRAGIQAHPETKSEGAQNKSPQEGNRRGKGNRTADQRDEQKAQWAVRRYNHFLRGKQPHKGLEPRNDTGRAIICAK